MKKFIAALCAAVLLSTGVQPLQATADELKYSRILSDGVVLYMDAGMTTPWFTLPYSYYVKIISVSGASAKVEYKSDNPSKPSAKGYILSSELNLVDAIPSVAYPSLVLTVNQNCMLYKDTDFTLTETVTQNSTIEFYGIFTRRNGDRYIYGYVNASSGDKYIGYISVGAVYDFTVPELPVEKPTLEPVESTSEKESESVKNDATFGNNLQILLIVAISVVAVSIVYLLFRPTPVKVKDEVITRSEFDEEE